jgi:surface antigen
LLPSTSVAAATPPAPPIEVCRAYTSMKTLLGQPRPVSGVTCRGQDGQWHIITELPN